MSKYLVALLAILIAPAAPAAETVAELLKQADAYRLQSAASRVDTAIAAYRGDTLDKERLYTIYLKPGRRSLVLMKSPAEAGQKLLMLGDQFWLLMPDTQRPLRITPTQKLLGEAATGDIANMTWSEDYEGKVVGETEIKGRRCLHLDLTAARAGVTYARIELYLDRNSKLPIKADLYVHSGKRAKEAWYEAKTVDGLQRIMSMTLSDDIQAGRRTVVRYLSIVRKEAPDAFFNPAALIRSNLAGW